MYLDLSTAFLALYGLATAFAVYLACWAAYVAKRAPLKRDVRIGKLEGDVDDLIGRINRLSGKVGRQVRDENAAEEAHEGPKTFAQRKGESPEQWKIRTRALLQRGVKP